MSTIYYCIFYYYHFFYLLCTLYFFLYYIYFELILHLFCIILYLFYCLFVIFYTLLSCFVLYVIIYLTFAESIPYWTLKSLLRTEASCNFFWWGIMVSTRSKFFPVLVFLITLNSISLMLCDIWKWYVAVQWLSR